MILAQGKYSPSSTVTTHATFYSPAEYLAFALTWPIAFPRYLADRWVGSTQPPKPYHYVLAAPLALITWLPGALLLAYYASQDRRNLKRFQAKFPHDYQTTPATPNYFRSPLED